MPAYQGEFDGLCGMYAIANAYELCGYGEIREELFHVACGTLAQARWPGVLREGTSFGDLKNMVSACQTEIEIQYDDPIDIYYPFWSTPARSSERYWRRLDEVFADNVVHCCIVGRETPSPHRIVTIPDTRRRHHFVDSDPFRPMYRKIRRAVNVGRRRRGKTQWRLNRREIILFMEKTP